jgi:hypothetical protein
MLQIGVVAILFVLSMAANALITRWSARRVLGLDVSVVKSGIIVLGRSFAALLAGFAIGYIIRLVFVTNGMEEVAGLSMNLQIGALAMVAGLSFLAYWVLLERVTNTNISLWGMTKTVATESVVLGVSVVGVSVILSAVFVLVR